MDIYLVKRGITIKLSNKIKQLPTTPGVYLMKDASGGILYVGKAKNLKRRVQSYFQNNKNHSPKTAKLVKHLTDFDVILTDTEFEAFMLECQLIQEIKPYYNKKMKSPQSYSYIEIKLDDDLRKIGTTNCPIENGNQLYFGPYSSKNTVERALQDIKDCYQINCTNPSNSKSACLNYSLGLCIGMCKRGPAVLQYNHIIDKIIDLLSGSDNWILEDLTNKMEAASSSFEFEKAVKLRDTIQTIHYLLKREKVIEFTQANQTIIVLEPLKEALHKLFLIKRNKVMLTETIQLDEQLHNTILNWVKAVMIPYFQSNPANQSKKLNQDEIDEAQIIYSYLSGSNCRYEIIPDTFFRDDNQNKLSELIDQLTTKQA